MDKIWQKLTKKKQQLDKYRPLNPEQLKNIQEWLDVEYTYTSNAIEGSTLGRKETALVIEKGLTVRGKTLREHLEAVNHIKAIEFVRSLASKKPQQIDENHILDIHQFILTGIDNQWAGKYRQVDVFIRGSDYEPPPPHRIAYLMKQMIGGLPYRRKVHPAKLAADLHFRLVAIHPFVDGNGRTARLLMNLVLLQTGYPIAIIKTEERETYIDAVEKGALSGELDDFYSIITTAVDRSLNAYLAAAKGKSIIPFFIDKRQIKEGNLLKIGQVADLAGVSIPTVRHYVSQRLIKPQTKTPGGFMLFNSQVVETIKQIKRLQRDQLLPLLEIRKKLRQN